MGQRTPEHIDERNTAICRNRFNRPGWDGYSAMQYFCGLHETNIYQRTLGMAPKYQEIAAAKNQVYNGCSTSCWKKKNIITWLYFVLDDCQAPYIVLATPTWREVFLRTAEKVLANIMAEKYHFQRNFWE
jgi:hypothetical protein